MRHRLAPEADYYRLPDPPRPALPPAGFALCSAAAIPGCTDEHWASVVQVYEQAFAQLEATARPALPERDLFFWN